MPFHGPEASLTLRHVIASCQLFNNSSYEEIESKTEVPASLAEATRHPTRGMRELSRGGEILDQNGVKVSDESNKDTVVEIGKVVKIRGLRTKGKQHARSRGGQGKGGRGSARGPRMIENATNE
ncbi:hypothetical protein MMC22_000230 [Lobaria immixta]|nr:hypothetical protein [Lobaria immixta]